MELYNYLILHFLLATYYLYDIYYHWNQCKTNSQFHLHLEPIQNSDDFLIHLVDDILMDLLQEADLALYE